MPKMLLPFKGFDTEEICATNTHYE